MVNPGVYGYTKTPNQPKISEKRKKTTTYWKPKEYLNQVVLRKILSTVPVRTDFSDSRDPIFSDSRDQMTIFSDSKDPIFNSSDPNRVPQTP